MDLWWLVGLIVVVILLCVAGIIFWFVWPTMIGAVWVPTARATIREMLTLAEVNPQDMVWDLGSGDGRILVMAAEDFGATAVGVEADPLRVLWSRRVIQRRKLGQRVNVVWGNFFHQSLAEATVVTVFQGQDINKRLKLKLAQELQPGTRVVSFRFPFQGWVPVQTTEDPRIYLYKM